MTIEDTSWPAEVRRRETAHRAARYKRWFKRDGERWIFAGTRGRRFRIDHETAAAIFAEGTDLEHKATATVASHSNLAVTFPLALAAAAAVAWTASTGLTAVSIAFWIVFAPVWLWLLVRTDLTVILATWKLRQKATRELIISDAQRRTSIAPLYPRLAFYDAFAILAALAMLAGLVLLIGKDGSPFIAGSLIGIPLIVFWPAYWSMRRAARRVSLDLMPLRTERQIPGELARRVRKARA